MHKLFIFLIMLFTSLNAQAQDFTLTTNAFSDSGTFPVLYTCDGSDSSPQLSWKNAPANTKSFVLLLSDPDARYGIWYHWVVYNIPNNVTEFVEAINSMPLGAVVAKNSWSKAQYSGPCPPPGPAHHYTFTLYALDNVLSLSKKADAETVLAAIQGHILQETRLIATYTRLAS